MSDYHDGGPFGPDYWANRMRRQVDQERQRLLRIKDLPRYDIGSDQVRRYIPQDQRPRVDGQRLIDRKPWRRGAVVSEAWSPDAGVGDAFEVLGFEYLLNGDREVVKQTDKLLGDMLQAGAVWSARERKAGRLV